MSGIEILAPAGGPDRLRAAVRAGADAVYLGMKGFNARRGAENFTADELREAVCYAHARNVRIHLTLNTIMSDGELPDFVSSLEAAAAAGVDALITQDLAAAKLARECCPDVRLHASTQMAVHNADGANMLRDLGFSRVVLARELSLDEITDITAKTDIETEVFVHGALCVSVSGMCYLSSVIGGRSGNRGMCAQPCRMDFSANGRRYALSLRDLSALDMIPELRAAGVCSLKIEGRMKSSDYVAAAVYSCCRAVAGEPYDKELLQAAFSRSGFTVGHLKGVRTEDMFGVRAESDKRASSAAAGRIAPLYKDERRSVPVNMRFIAKSGRPSGLCVSDGENGVSVHGPVPETASGAGLTDESLLRTLSKTGGTPFYADGFSADADGGLYLPVSALNMMRRDALSLLLEKREAPKPHGFYKPAAMSSDKHIPSDEPLLIRCANAAQARVARGHGIISLPLEMLAQGLSDDFDAGEIAAEIPPCVFQEYSEDIRAALEKVRKTGIKRALAENIGAIGMARRMGMEIYGGACLNIYNGIALSEYEKLGISHAVLSFEISADDAASLGGGMPRGLIGYGRLPLMRLRACPLRGKDGCGRCPGRGYLRDRLGKEFPVLCDKRRYSTLHNHIPLYIGDRKPRGMDFFMLYFTDETADEAARVISLWEDGAPYAGERTRGLYYREVL